MIKGKKRIISDAPRIRKYLDFKEKINKDAFIEIIGYRIEDLNKVTKRLSEKKYNPKPLYTKNFF